MISFLRDACSCDCMPKFGLCSFGDVLKSKLPFKWFSPQIPILNRHTWGLIYDIELGQAKALTDLRAIGMPGRVDKMALETPHIFLTADQALPTVPNFWIFLVDCSSWGLLKWI